MSERRKAAIVGGGVIGGGWAARFLLNGWDVSVFDPDPEAERKISDVLENARRSLPSLYDRALPQEGTLTFETDLSRALEDTSWVQESVPERLDLKHQIHHELTRLTPSDAIIGSSTSGFKPSHLTAKGARVIVAHPFNPVYLLPLVELVGDEGDCKKASTILTSLGMKPLFIRREIDAHIADRLLEAVWREGLWLIKDEICTTEELDNAIRFGFGLRWAQMGLFETYRIAGGEAGMKHFLAQFGPALQWPWTKLMDVPKLDDDLVSRIAQQSDAQSGHHTVRELERIRDDNLVGIMRALKKTGSGAGALLQAHEETLEPHSKAAEAAGPLTTVCQRVPQSWTDYNGHMNESHYLEVGSRASDRFMEFIGCDADYIAAGSSYFTVESHIRYLCELHQGELLTVTTQVLLGAGKKLHLYHTLHGPSGAVCASVETFLLHVDLKKRQSSLPTDDVQQKLEDIARRHSELPRPDNVVLS